MKEAVKGIIIATAIIAIIAVVLFYVTLTSKSTEFTLSSIEKETLAKHTTLEVGYLGDNSPFAFESKLNYPVGLEPEAMERIADLLGVKLKFRELNYNSMTSCLEKKLVDAVICIPEEFKIKESVKVLPIYDVPLSIYVDSKLKPVDSVKELRNIGYLRGRIEGKFLIDFVIFRPSFDSIDEMMRAIKEGRIPAICIKRQTFQAWKRGNEYGSFLRAFDENAVIMKDVLHVHKDNEKLRAVLARAIRFLDKKEEFQRIERDYVGVAYTHDSDLPNKNKLYAYAILAVTCLLILLTFLYSRYKKAKSDALAQSTHPMADYINTPLLTRYTVRQIIASLVKNLRLMTVIYESSENEIITVPENLKESEREVYERILSQKSPNFMEPVPSSENWFTTTLPRGGRLSIKARTASSGYDFCLLAYLFGVLAETSSIAIDSVANERALKDILKVGFDISGNVLIVANLNFEIEEAYGIIAPFEPSKHIGKNLLDYIDKKSLSHLNENLQKAQQSQRFDLGGQIYLRSSGTSIPCSYRMTLKILSRGERIILTVKDERISQRALDSAQDSYRVDSIGIQAASYVSTFETMFLAIQGYSNLLAAENQNPKLSEQIRRITDYAQTGARLSDALMAIASGKKSSPKILELSTFFEEYFTPIANAISTHNVRMPKQMNSIFVDVDPIQLILAVFPIVLNSMEAAPHDSDIEITTRFTEVSEEHRVITGILSPATYAVIQISDEGVGIPPKDLLRVCDPFFTTKEPPHRGLGITASLSSVLSCGGAIDVISETGKGTKVLIYVPARETSVPQETDLTGQNQSILVINPSQEWLDILCSIFSRYNFQPSGVYHRKDALTLIKLQAFDVILVDAEQGGVDTALFVEEIRRIRPTVPVVIVLGAGESRAFSRLFSDKRSKVVVRTGDVKQIVRNVNKILAELSS